MTPKSVRANAARSSQSWRGRCRLILCRMGPLPALLAFAAALVPGAARATDPGAVLAGAMAGTRVPAMGLAVLRDGHIADLAVRGVRASTGDDPVRIDDPWHIGSDAKAMTAVLIARLVERGLLHWDDRVGDRLPLAAATMKRQYVQRQYVGATLADLLSHHAGLPRDLIDAGARAALFFGPGPADPRERRLRYVARALADPPEGPRGSFHYANTGYLVAAAMAEAVTGEPFETLLQREVLAPLEIDRARFVTTGPGELQGHRGGRPTGPAESNPPFFAPAGGLILPLADWAQFCLDQLAGAQGRGQLLTRGDYRRMQSAQGAGDYGMGWEIAADYAGHAGPVLVHAGSDTSWYAMAVLFPAAGTGVLVVANAGPDMGGEAAVRSAVRQAVSTAVATIVPGL